MSAEDRAKLRAKAQAYVVYPDYGSSDTLALISEIPGLLAALDRVEALAGEMEHALGVIPEARWSAGYQAACEFYATRLRTALQGTPTP